MGMLLGLLGFLWLSWMWLLKWVVVVIVIRVIVRLGLIEAVRIFKKLVMTRSLAVRIILIAPVALHNDDGTSFNVVA